MEADNRVFRALGGRKAASGLLAAILLTAMAFPLDAGFIEYSGALLVALGLTAGTIAWEDRKRAEIE